LRKLIVLMNLPQKGRLLQKVPSAAMGAGENRHQSLFLFAFPNLRHRRIPAAVSQGLHPQITVQQNKAYPLPNHNHRDDLPYLLDGTGQCQALFGPLNPRVPIAKTKLGNLDLFYLPKMSALHSFLTFDGGIELPTAPHIHKLDTYEAPHCQPRRR